MDAANVVGMIEVVPRAAAADDREPHHAASKLGGRIFIKVFVELSVQQRVHNEEEDDAADCNHGVFL